MTDFYDYLVREIRYSAEYAQSRERAIDRLVEFGYTEDQLMKGNITALVDSFFVAKGARISQNMTATYRNALRLYRNFRESCAW